MTYGKDIGEEELATSALSQKGEYDAVPEEEGGWTHAREEGEGISSENEGEPEEGTSSEPDGAESVPEPEKRRENPFDDGAAYRGEIVTEAVVHERKLPHTAGFRRHSRPQRPSRASPGCRIRNIWREEDPSYTIISAITTDLWTFCWNSSTMPR